MRRRAHPRPIRTIAHPRHAFGRSPELADASLVLRYRRCTRSIDRAMALVKQVRRRSDIEDKMRKTLPEQMFIDPDKSRLTMLRSWVLDHQVTEIDMNERQFWNFAALQPVAEKPWTSFMGRVINVPDMPTEAQKKLGIFNMNSPGMI